MATGSRWTSRLRDDTGRRVVSIPQRHDFIDCYTVLYCTEKRGPCDGDDDVRCGCVCVLLWLVRGADSEHSWEVGRLCEINKN